MRYKTKSRMLIARLSLIFVFSSVFPFSFAVANEILKLSFVAPPVPYGLNITQLDSWNELQRYNAWLYSMPDFDDFTQKFIRLLDEHDITVQQLNAGLYDFAMAKGGNFSLIKSYINNWYMEYRNDGFEILSISLLLDIFALTNGRNYPRAINSSVSAYPQVLFPKQSIRNSISSYITNSTTFAIVMFFFFMGVVVSILAVFIFRSLFTNASYSTEAQDSAKKYEPSSEKEYIDVEFTESAPRDDFDYPYEDIGDALKGNNNVG